MSETTELLPCPFCGGKAEPYSDYSICDSYWMMCLLCTSMGAAKSTMQAAIDAWNRRPDCAGEGARDELRARVIESLADVRELTTYLDDGKADAGEAG